MDGTDNTMSLSKVSTVCLDSSVPLGLTVPLLPIERWLSCCVRGPIIGVGWMDMVWSMPGVRTWPYGHTHTHTHTHTELTFT